MENKSCIGIWEGTIQKMKEIAEIIFLCVFIILLCILFTVIRIVYLLLDCTVRKLEYR